jgi:hypothetical protein
MQKDFSSGSVTPKKRGTGNLEPEHPLQYRHAAEKTAVYGISWYTHKKTGPVLSSSVYQDG